VLHIIHGPDSFTARQTIKALCAERQKSEIEGPDTTVWLEQKSTSPGVVMDALTQGALFGSPPPVVLEGLLTRFEPSKSGGSRGRKSKKKKDGPTLGPWDPFPAMVAALPDTSLLIIYDGLIKGPNPMLKAIQSHATETHVLSAPDAGHVARWVQQRVAEEGASITPEAVRSLAMNANGDLWYVSSELEKLLVYAEGRTITGEMAGAMVTGMPTTTIFALVDAIVEGRQSVARHHLDTLYHEGIAAGYVLTMIHRQLRLMAMAKDNTRGSSDGTKNELTGLHPFAQDKARKQASRYSLPAVHHAMKAVIAADRSIKTGLSDERAALELLITEMLPASARR